MAIGCFFRACAVGILLCSLLPATALVCNAQHQLMREIAIGSSGSQRIGDVLQEISQNQGFYFAYNSHTVPADSVVVLSGFRGTLSDFLQQLFGNDYEFKESPGYVIIRYAPVYMQLMLQVESGRGRPLVVTGRITDAETGSGIHLASIYERNVLASTLSDPMGNFKLNIKRPDETIWLTISKENYRDTTVALIPPVQVKARNKGRRYWFYPDDGDGLGLENTAFGRFFTNSKQRIQSINLDGFFAYNAYQVSLTPRLSSQGMFNSQVVNQVSVNIIGGNTAGVDGVEVGGVFNINQKDAQHFQAAGVFNLVGRHVQGIQVAGVSNIVMREVTGLQVAGVSNRSGYVKGMQLAGIFNVARDVKGVQLAGLVNIADSSDYPIGLVNLIKNGRKSIMAGTDESSLAQVAFRSGGRVLYGVVAGGYYMNDNPMKYAFEMGFGAHLLQVGAIGIDAEVVNRIRTNLKRHHGHGISLRVLPQLGLGRHFGILVGPTVNYTFPIERSGGSETSKSLQMGVYGGLSYRW